ncbi:hypothetical protein [Microcoleus sp. LEGE 07076]|nr:hypothetical protein [Microcoleus sp. LEGE 07076]
MAWLCVTAMGWNVPLEKVSSLTAFQTLAKCSTTNVTAKPK